MVTILKTNNQLYELTCINCKRVVDENKEYTNCLNCNQPLDIIYDYSNLSNKFTREFLESKTSYIEKYLDLFPINDLQNFKVLSMSEGNTPLLKSIRLNSKLNISQLYFKDEGKNPTGAFKDRGSLIEVCKALEMNKKAVIVASSGNMAASLAAYCARAGLPLFVLIPENIPNEKLSQISAYGANLIKVNGDYNHCAMLAETISKKYEFYLAGDYIFRLEGQKSQAYEIIEQLNWEVPNKIFVPIGCGTNISAIWKGFKELKELGLIDQLPQMVGVQSSSANPVVKAFLNGDTNVQSLTPTKTISSAIFVGDPLDGKKALTALVESNGYAIEVTDEETLIASSILSRKESLFVEPSSATVLAALLQLSKKDLNQKSIASSELEVDHNLDTNNNGKQFDNNNKNNNKLLMENDTVVLVITGYGLKDPLPLNEIEITNISINEFDVYSYFNNLDILVPGNEVSINDYRWPSFEKSNGKNIINSMSLSEKTETKDPAHSRIKNATTSISQHIEIERKLIEPQNNVNRRKKQ